MSLNVGPQSGGSVASTALAPVECGASCPAGVRALCGGDCRDERFRRACEWAERGAEARRNGDEANAEQAFRAALAQLLAVIEGAGPLTESGWSLEAVLFAARCALDAGAVDESRRLIDLCDCPLVVPVDGVMVELRDIDAWPDVWLVAAVRSAAPDERALDVLARRHWPALFGRCQILTACRDQAADLAQEAWCRVLRRREALKPGGNFPAYLQRVATNLWRDWLRANQRAGVLGETRLGSLDAEVSSDGESRTLIDVVPDWTALEGAAAAQLQEEVQEALSRLAPLLRDVLVARFLDGESCAEIGRRHGRTEQTVSGWIRRGVQEIQVYLKQSPVIGQLHSTP